MEMQAFDAHGTCLYARVYYSTGGGFTASHSQLSKPVKNDKVSVSRRAVPYDFGSAKDLLNLCAGDEITIADLIFANFTLWL